MLSPSQVKNHHFQMTRSTYRSVEVDDFLREVAESYEQMYRENGKLIDKINILADQVEAYRKDEDNIRAALLTAQRMADSITREAQEKAEAAVSQAKKSAEELQASSKAQAEQMLSNAGRQADKTVGDAKEVAENVLSQAKIKSEEITAEAKKEIVIQQRTLDTMKAEVSKFRGELMAMYKEHVEMIAKLPELIVESVEQEQTASQPEEPAAPAPQSREEPVTESAQADPEEEPPVPEEPEEEAEEAVTEEIVEEAEVSFEEEPEAEAGEEEPQEKPIDYFAGSRSENQVKIKLDDLITEYEEEAEPAAPPIERIKQKYGELKFGEDYDITEDDDEIETLDEKPKKRFFRKK